MRHQDKVYEAIIWIKLTYNQYKSSREASYQYCITIYLCRIVNDIIGQSDIQAITDRI